MSDEGGGLFWGAVLGAGAVLGYQYLNPPKKADPPPRIETQPLPRPTGKIELFKDNDDNAWILDADSVRGPRQKRLAWITVNVAKPAKNGNTYSQTLYQADCTTTGAHILASIAYDKHGDPLFRADAPPRDQSPTYYAPESNGGSVISAMCSAVYDGGNDSPPPMVQIETKQKVSPN